ncbi:MAG: ATP-binding protein, partial [Acidobacteriota bacterium]
FRKLRQISDDQIRLSDAGDTRASTARMLEAAQQRRSAFDYAGTFADLEAARRGEALRTFDNLRLGLTLILIAGALLILIIGTLGVLRFERGLHSRVNQQIQKTQTIISGMADGVMLVDEHAEVEFINPAGERLLGDATIRVPLEKQAEVYGFFNAEGRRMTVEEIPAAKALATGKPVKDVMVVVDRGAGRRLDLSMNAVPIREAGSPSGVIVTFRDVTERRRLEAEMQLQAERSQILADAGAFFSSNIDPQWVNQAIAERVAEILGDWSAVILRNPGSSQLEVAAIYHRDMASLGLAWSYIYRQPLVFGEGTIGQVISSGFPSLTSNLESAPATQSTTYHVSHMKPASLLVLPLRTRREVIGALVIAATDPEHQMTDQKLPLAELLAERAALAIENADLYTEQVEARRKLEDLSRLKDEFLSIASHELRTPVTSIKGYTQLARTLINENDLKTAEEYLVVALDQIDRMSRLILELLDVSRIETGRLDIRRERLPWSKFVREIVKHHHTYAGTRLFHISAVESDVVVEGDRDRLEQVLANLLDNAVKYSPDGTDISVKVRTEPDRVITAISDQGMGIPPDEIGQIFERFHRGRQVSSTNYGGLGLGLYISKQIVERHGGTIWVESREGAGTTFYFSLPFQANELVATG